MGEGWLKIKKRGTGLWGSIKNKVPWVSREELYEKQTFIYEWVFA